MQSSPGCREERTAKDRSISITEKEYATGNEEVGCDHPAMRTVLSDMAERMNQHSGNASYNLPVKGTLRRTLFCGEMTDPGQLSAAETCGNIIDRTIERGSST